MSIPEIIIENARENNLKGVSLRIPHYRLIAVTGVSGSGKTSLVHDVVGAEGQRLFFENFTGGRYGSARPSRPKADRIEGLFPVIAIDQNQTVRSPRSTVGTLTELYDLLRLLFARLGKSDNPDLHPYRSLFSFNLPDGWCPDCKGLGVQDHIDPALLIGDESKTIREGAFVLTTPNNYIIYSQVTMDVLDQVCRAEGFSVDIPWKDLTEEQQNIVLRGSTKIKVLFGKHPLESRLRWTGITAKPREEDYYKGVLTVMEDILKRDRNPNIMRFARSRTCERCGGKRLNEKALSVKLWDRDISSFSEMSIKQVHAFFTGLQVGESESPVVEPVREAILKRTALLMKLGAGHLSLNRESSTLNGGEGHRIRLANQAAGGLRNVLYILDEPSAGLHPSEQKNLLEVIRSLVNLGNTVMLVDHDEQSIRQADWIVDIGPGAGEAGGRILYNGPAAEFFSREVSGSITWKYLTKRPRDQETERPETRDQRQEFQAEDANRNNLRDISPRFLVNGFNVITGVSGSGKTSLVEDLMENTIRMKRGGTEVFRKVIHIDSSPIGRTPNSNPATYSGLSDHVRDLMASLPESKARGYKKGQFSFVVKGGRCESCGGAGVQQIGMHFLGNVEVVCDVCEGKRFTDETLEIRYNGQNIFEILELTIDEAHRFFEGQKKITAITGILTELGLGYLKLGQPSTTLSGGEAQRVKLATELSRPASGQTLYILDEPATGLHMADVETLLAALKKLISKGHTLLCIEHDPAFILEADWMVDLGPGSADEGGRLVAEGRVADLLDHPESVTAAELRKFLARDKSEQRTRNTPCNREIIEAPIRLTGVETNNLRHIDIDFPVNKITAVTGVSGSGKSSLVYGTLFAESQRRFLEGQSARVRQFTAKAGTPVLEEATGLVPSIALQKRNPVRNPRSTVATFTGLYDVYRLLFSRLAVHPDSSRPPLSTAFSFNHEEGACPVCKGLGTLTVCDADRLVTHPDQPLSAGALDGTKTGRFYGEPYGQYVATLLAAGKKIGIDFRVPYRELDERTRKIAMEGLGEEKLDVEWKYKRGNHEGVHRMTAPWPGFLRLVETEYLRKHADARGEAMLDLMKIIDCPECQGYRLKPEMLRYTVGGLHIGEVTALAADDAIDWFTDIYFRYFTSETDQAVADRFREPIFGRLEALQKSGLGYMTTGRIVSTLSGGEYQRLQLAQLVRAPLTGAAYLLDEPSFGLHPKDTARIAGLITGLNRQGNSVIMVEHSPLLIGEADFVLEMEDGQRRKEEGGRRKEKRDRRPETRDLRPKTREGLRIRGARANNLRDIDVEIQAGGMTVITGVSGSGKTSLLDRVIYASHVAGRAVNCGEITGWELFSDLIYIGQSLLGTGYQATAGSLLGVSGMIAAIYAGSEGSRERKFKASHFTAGSRDGRCPDCEGTGLNRVSLDFFADAVTPCERCGGTGFRDEVLEVVIDGQTIYDALQISFKDLFRLIEAHQRGKPDQRINSLSGLIEKTGLGHLTGGRLLKTLSTGELQRLKLVSGLSFKTGAATLILLDEPTGGLHPKDIERLLKLFDELLQSGNTIVCVTHEPLLIDSASCVIELGPGGGRNGGQIVMRDT